MLSRLFRFLTAAVIFGLAWCTFVEASEPGLPQATRAPVGGEASIPYGWVDFCNRHNEECTLGKLKPMDVRLNKAELEGPQRDQQQGQQRDRADQQFRPLGHDARPLGPSGRRQGRLQDLCFVQAQAARRPRLSAPSSYLMTIVRRPQWRGPRGAHRQDRPWRLRARAICRMRSARGLSEYRLSPVLQALEINWPRTTRTCGSASAARPGRRPERLRRIKADRQ